GRVAEAAHCRILSVEEGQGAVLLRSVQGKTLPQMFLSRGQFTEPEETASEGPVRFYQQHGILPLSGQSEELLREFTRGVELRPFEVKCPQGVQHREALRVILQLLTQLEGAGVGLFDFERHVTFCGN